MKRFPFLVILGFSIFIVGPSAFAQLPPVDIKASGFIDMVSFLYRNIAPGTPGQGIYSFTTPPMRPDASPSALSEAWNRTSAYIESRARLKIQAMTGKALSGTLFFEMDSFRWGEAGTGPNEMGRWGADSAAVEVKNVYFDVALPYLGIPLPMMLRLGVQPLYVRPYIFTYTDGAGITAAIKIDPVTIMPMWFKPLEGKVYASDDVDVYGLNLSAEIDQLTLGGFGFYYNMNTYPLSNVTLTYGENPTYQSDMWWLGLYAEGKVGPIDLNFDVVYDYGEVRKEFGSPAPDVDYRGWATRLTVNYPWDNFNIGATVMYASGADQKKTSDSGLPGTGTPYGSPTTKVGSYVTPPGSEQWAGGESLIAYGSWVCRSDIGFFVWPWTAGTNLTRGGWGGTWFAKLFAGYKVTPWYKTSLEILYIGDTTQNGNTLGDARSNGKPRDDRTIGWEFDLIHTFNIYQNLKFEVGMGYLVAGDALDQSWPYEENASFKNPWILATHLTFEF